jgi:hypothetical protein
MVEPPQPLYPSGQLEQLDAVAEVVYCGREHLVLTPSAVHAYPAPQFVKSLFRQYFPDVGTQGFLQSAACVAPVEEVRYPPPTDSQEMGAADPLGQ